MIFICYSIVAAILPMVATTLLTRFSILKKNQLLALVRSLRASVPHDGFISVSDTVFASIFFCNLVNFPILVFPGVLYWLGIDSNLVAMLLAGALVGSFASILLHYKKFSAT